MRISSLATFFLQGLKQRKGRLGGSLVKLFLMRRIVEMSMRGKH